MSNVNFGAPTTTLLYGSGRVSRCSSTKGVKTHKAPERMDLVDEEALALSTEVEEYRDERMDAFGRGTGLVNLNKDRMSKKELKRYRKEMHKR